MPKPEFVSFPKIARWNREVVVTEKLDGTNAQIWISDDGTEIAAGSRNRWITPSDDNFGFAAWVEAHRDELIKLGPGSHFGEWWGAGIQRRYGLTEKRFSLFNVARWSDDATRPACCHVVPTLWRGFVENFGAFGEDPERMGLSKVMIELGYNGSRAAPGFMKPEGIVIYHTASGALYKRTIEGDESPKSKT